MSHTRPSFPLPCRDIRPADYLSELHYVLVLKGSSSPPARPIYSWGEAILSARVDDQCLWDVYEWSYLPQLYDPKSPWLMFTPLYRDPGHFTRLPIDRTMLVDAPRDVEEWHKKEPLYFAPAEELKESIKAYTRGCIERASKDMAAAQKIVGLEGLEDIVWPQESIDRATYLSRRLIIGLPSLNSFKHAMTALRRAVRELEGFSIWAAVVQAAPEDRPKLASVFLSQGGADFRGVFLSAKPTDWLSENSAVRSVYTRIAQWSVPIYALVKAANWAMQPTLHLSIQVAPFPIIKDLQSTPSPRRACYLKELQLTTVEAKEVRQLPFFCYPPQVPATSFERAARGLNKHSEQGEEGFIRELGTLNVARAKTQDQQRSARLQPKVEPRGKDNRNHPEWQARMINSTPPTFMTYFRLSDFLKLGYGPERLAPQAGKGIFLPRPSTIWGAPEQRRETMLETLTLVWKLLVLRASLFWRGDLDARRAYLTPQDWRSLLVRINSDASGAVIWSEGKQELWGTVVLPSVVQRSKNMEGEPTLQKMDCDRLCLPWGKFSHTADPRNELQHLVLFRLAELHVLHDFASYHPALQRERDGRWCPPPFDAQEILDDRPKAFPGLNADASDAEAAAMQDILTVVRWNGVDGTRAWEMQDCQSYREWLTAFRALLSQCPEAWVGNPALDGLQKDHPDFQPLTCDLTRRETPVGRVLLLLMQTHSILCMRKGRLPWLWFDKPKLRDLKCEHD